MTLSSYLGLLAVSAVLAITPGQDTMLSLRNALLSRRAGLGAATGSSVAALIWAALAATGLAALFQASPVAYELLSLIGGLYVIFLGVRAMRSARITLKAHRLAPPTSASPPWSVAPTIRSPQRSPQVRESVRRQISRLLRRQARARALADQIVSLRAPRAGGRVVTSPASAARS